MNVAGNVMERNARGWERKRVPGKYAEVGNPEKAHNASGRSRDGHCRLEVPWELASGAPISIRAEEAWKISRGSPDITIAIIDEGFDVGRLPAVSNVEVLSASGYATSAGRCWGPGHGARLSELIVGNREGYPGVAPQCRLLLIELPSFCTDAEEARAFDLAFQSGAAAVCCAWGPPFRGQNVHRPMPASVSAAIERLVRKGRGGRGSLVFFAVGNCAAEIALDGYASHGFVTAVGGITNRGGAPRYSDFGNKIGILAPTSSSGAFIGGVPGLPAGNSGAAALVTAVAGLVLSVNPNLFASQVHEILKRTSVVPHADQPMDNPARRCAVVDAGKAVIEATKVVPLRERFRPVNALSTSPRPALKFEKRALRERRYNGGEHSFFGLTAAWMLQKLYHQAPGSPEAAFYGTLFSAYNPPGGAPTYSDLVAQSISDFFADNIAPTATIPPTDRSVPQINNYPCLTSTANGATPFGYLVGLAADVYSSPADLLVGLDMPLTMLSADGDNASTNNNFYDILEYFRREIIQNFQFDDDVLITAASLPDPLSHYIGNAKKNYSHFAGHNLLFYLSHHLLAVNDAIQCGNPGPAASQADVTQNLNKALAREAFALHFLTDMFSAGHARDPRWAFLHGALKYTDNTTFGAGRLFKMGGNEAHLISKLLHDYDGTQGCLAMNAAESKTTQPYLYKLYGDGSLDLNTLAQPDNLIYFNNAAKSSLDNATMGNEPIQWGAYMPTVRAASDLLRRFDLITGLICISIADVFRHMAQNMTLETSATGGPGPSRGLLGYVLERVPLALPIQSALAPDANVTDPIKNALMAKVYPVTSGGTGALDYSTTELSSRLMQYGQLFDTYQKITWVLKTPDQQYSNLPTFIAQYCKGKFDAASSTTSTQLEKDWVAAQVQNLSTTIPSGFAAAIPAILGKTKHFASSIVGTDNPGAVSLPPQWIAAVPNILSTQLCTNPTGIWGIEP